MDNNSKEKKPYYLRKLRRGVTLRFNGYDHDGIPHWLLYDEGQNKFYEVGWTEYEMLSRWYLGDPASIIHAVNTETTLKLEIKDIEQLIDFLNRNYLVEQRWRSVYQQAKDQKVIKSDNLFYWFIRYYLFFRIPLFHPDKFLNKTKYIGKFIFSHLVFYIMLGLFIIAVYQIGQQWEEFKHTFASIFSWQGLFFYFIAFSIAKFFHEFGHAYMCKLYGVSVPTMGIAFLVFWPVLYTDTTQSWSLPSHQRLRIALAGMWVETYVTIIAAIIWANTYNLTIQMTCYVMVAINWVSTFLINASPFMRFDGYYALSDILKVPNLQNRSFALARWQIRNWLFDLDEPMPEQFSNRMHWILVTYAIVTWIYRLIIYIAIAILVYHYFFKAAGIILFIIELFAFILRPIFLEFKHWYELRNQFSLNKRSCFTIICTTILLLLFFLPIQQGIKINATLSHEHEFIYALQDAILQNKIPERGTLVKKGEVIIKLKSPELDANLKKTQFEYEKIEAKIRRAAFNKNYSAQLAILEAELSEKKAQYNKLMKLNEQLIIKAPFNGVISDVSPNAYPGNMIMKNSWIIDILNPQLRIIEGFVEQPDFEEIKVGLSGFFYPINLEDPKIPVKVIGIESINTAQLIINYSKQSESKRTDKKNMPLDTPIFHSNVLGGNIPTEITEKGEYIPVDSIYRVLLLPEDGLNSNYLDRVKVGMVIVTTNPHSLAYRTLYKIKKILIQESGF